MWPPLIRTSAVTFWEKGDASLWPGGCRKHASSSSLPAAPTRLQKLQGSLLLLWSAKLILTSGFSPCCLLCPEHASSRCSSGSFLSPHSYFSPAITLSMRPSLTLQTGEVLFPPHRSLYHINLSHFLQSTSSSKKWCCSLVSDLTPPINLQVLVCPIHTICQAHKAIHFWSFIFKNNYSLTENCKKKKCRKDNYKAKSCFFLKRINKMNKPRLSKEGGEILKLLKSEMKTGPLLPNLQK